MITLYSLPPSGNAQKARLALRLLGLPFKEVSLSGGAHKQTPFTALNPLAQVPVLTDGDVVIRDSQAILTYLAAAHAPGAWDGRSPAERGRIAQWLSLASNEIANGIARLRANALFGAAIDREAASALTQRVLFLIENQLAGGDWLEGGRLTIADLACAPYLALAGQGGVDLTPFPGVRAWTGRIAALPKFPDMNGWSALDVEHHRGERP